MKTTDAIEWMRKSGVRRIKLSVLEEFVENADPEFIGTNLKSNGIVVEFPDSQARDYFLNFVLPWEVTIDPKLFGKDSEWDTRGKIQYAGIKYIICSPKFYREHVRPLMPQEAQ